MHDKTNRSAIAILTLGLGLTASLSQGIAQTSPAPSTAPTATIGAPAMPQMGGSTQAARGITEYLGGGFMTFNDACAHFGWTGTHQIMVRAQPQGMPGNEENMSQLALFFSTGVIAMRYDAVERGWGDTKVDQASYVWNGPFIPQTPSMTITYSTRYGGFIPNGHEDLLSVLLTFRNFNEHDGCEATARVSLGRI